jgi:hyaluronate lyase
MRKKGLLILFAVVLFVSGTRSGGNVSAAEPYDGLRAKWKTMLLGNAYDVSDPDISAKITIINETVSNTSDTGYWDTLQKGNNRTNCQCLWTDYANPNDTKAMNGSYVRLREMAIAHETIGSTLYQNATLKSDIVQALDWLYNNWYYIRPDGGAAEYPTPFGNWFHWQIGVPTNLSDIMILLYDDLTSAQRNNWISVIDYYNADNGGISGPYRGANRVYRATIHAVRGILGESSSKLILAKNGLSDLSDGHTGALSVFKYVTAGDGFYEDGSFIQHGNNPYNGGYGYNLLQDIANVMYLLKGTTWELTDPESDHIWKWVSDSFDPLMDENGLFLDMVRGRDIAKHNRSNQVAGHTAMMAIIRLSQLAATEDAVKYKRIIKSWLQKDSTFYNDATIEMIVLAKTILNDSSIASRNDHYISKVFPKMARAVHQRPGFGMAVSMSSNKVARYEADNGENRKGWHTGDGMTYLYNADINQYSDQYFSTVDYYRLPGTTVDIITRSNSEGEDTTTGRSWVGGVNFKGKHYSSAGMELQGMNVSLKANKSWFMFDDEIVAIGSGITSSDNRTIETIVDNRKINSTGTNAFTVGSSTGTVQLNAFGSASSTHVNWLHVAGNTSGSDVGYYFPQSSTIKSKREARTGKWSAVNSSYYPVGDPSYTRNYLTYWLDHGTNPTNSKYAYAILPNKSSSQVGAYSSDPNIRIWEQSAEAHAVKEKGLNIVGYHFWKDIPKTVYIDGDVTKPFLTANKKAAVMTKGTDEEFYVSVSDPTQQNTGTIELEIERTAVAVITKDPRVTVVSLSPTIKLSVDVNGAMGMSQHIVLSSNADGKKRLQAEHYNNMKGVGVYHPTTDASGESHINEAHDGDWLRYDNVNFASGVSSASLRIAGHNSGGIIELRTGSMSGTLIGSASISSTGGWDQWSNVQIPVSGAGTGFKSLYVLFKKNGASAVANLNWIEFD